MSKTFEYLLVGGGNAAGYACREFVAQGLSGAGKLGIVTAEAVPPYERPALTKAYLHPPTAKVRARLPGFHTCVGGGGERQTPEWYAEKGIELIQGRAEKVDLGAKRLKVGDTDLTYEKLIIATGARAVKVSSFGVKGDDLQNVFYVREEKEAAELVKAMEALNGSGKVVIVGGGYIGLECAAALSGWGLQTTMVFPEANCMPRLFNAELGKWLEDEYTSRGIKVVKGDVVSEFLGDGKLTSVKLKSGQTLECDVAVVGVGAAANVEFCDGLDMEKGGFKVDASMQTSDASVFAIGDVAAFPSQYGGLARCEHVDHARKSASQAVKAAMGLKPEAYKYLPCFYSRLFEYTDAPIVFNFFGSEDGECKVCKRGDKPIVFNFFGSEDGECKVCSRGEKSIGAIWVKDSKVTGAFLMGSPGPSADDQAKLREIATAQPASADPASVFAAAKL